MTPSLPCDICGQVDDLETVNPRGILAQELVRKAIEAKEMEDTYDKGA